MSQAGDFFVSSQISRKQEHNYKDALQKMQGYVDEAAIEPKEKNLKPVKEPEATKFFRVDHKRKSSVIKNRRGSQRFE